MPDDDVQLTDLEVIQQFSLAVRGATATRAQVIAALEADLAYLNGSRRQAAAKPAAPADDEVATAPVRTAPAAPRRTAPATATRAPAKVTKAPAAKAPVKATRAPARTAAKSPAKAPAKAAKKATRSRG